MHRTQSQDEEEVRFDLLELLRAAAKFGKFKLASGRDSDFYIDARLVTMSPFGASVLSDVLGDILRKKRREYRQNPQHYRRITAIGGPATAACPIITAAGIGAFSRGLDTATERLKSFYVRSAPKEHGTKKLIEGAELDALDYVLLFDDVATSGGSLIKAIDAVRATGAVCDQAIVLVDRLEGAFEALREHGVRLQPIFTRENLASTEPSERPTL